MNISSGINGQSVGGILVLFILLILAIRFIPPAAARPDNCENGLSILASKSFYVSNALGYYNLRSIFLYGDFESPVPGSHTITPFRNFSFQVRNTGGTNVANAIYAIVDRITGIDAAQVAITMRVDSVSRTSISAIFSEGAVGFRANINETTATITVPFLQGG
ncbi:hypothetical protein [Paenibacillus herberti]|uniref:Uncharacterized protein n=1 Tax=Paenibacillus herberti TaxID=1619309 RepID=A0A229NUI8_9BACL|nr:hypothetical protein [Paenibacillus herberti]OXM13567.1 hypothetical protein CGZ75_21270 [Paenibacillus herberti]